MNRMGGILFMVIGVVIFIVGMVIYSKKTSSDKPITNDNELNEIIEVAIADGVLTDNEKGVIKRLAIEKSLDYDSIIDKLEEQISSLNSDSAETEKIDFNKRNGEDFEKFIVQKFDKKYFTIKEWVGDKFINGVYAKTTLQPDLLLEFKLKNETQEFSVECKWRSNFYMNGIEFSTVKQFKRYQEFERKRKIPVFIAIGLAGKGHSPEHLYILPLKSINSNFISSEKLKYYEKKVGSNFFFNLETKELN